MSGAIEAQGIVQNIRSSFEYETLLEEYNVNETQLSRGEAHINTLIALFPQIAFGARNSNCSCQVEGYVREPHITFFFPVAAPPKFVSEVSFDKEGHCFAFSTEQFRIVFPNDYQHEFLSLKTGQLSAFFNEDDQQELSEFVRLIGKTQCSPASKARLLQDLRMSIEIFTSRREILNNKLIVKDISARLVYSLYACLQASASNGSNQRTHKIKSGLRYNIIRRTLRFIDTQDISGLSIAEIARAACVSIRTLEYAFTSILNMTPKQYLITLRLNAIRRELVDAQPGTTIKSILARYGVINQGRFSCDYYKLFGQRPSDTKQERKNQQL